MNSGKSESMWFKASFSKMAQLRLFPFSVFRTEFFQCASFSILCVEVLLLSNSASSKISSLLEITLYSDFRLFSKKHPNLGRRSSLRHKGKCWLLPSPFLHFSIFKKTRYLGSVFEFLSNFRSNLHLTNTKSHF